MNKLENLKSDPNLIKNPFVCNSIRGVRLSLEKDPKSFRGDSQLCHKVELENGNTYLHNPTDERLSFMCGKVDIRDELKEMTDISKYDYEVPADELNKTSKVKHKDGLPLSFIQITTEEEGLEWYANHYPKLPTDLLPIIARYHWGEPITKKGLKNEKKKITKKAEKKGLVVMTKETNNNNPFIVKFD
jgi:hypothetical protein